MPKRTRSSLAKSFLAREVLGLIESLAEKSFTRASESSYFVGTKEYLKRTLRSLSKRWRDGVTRYQKLLRPGCALPFASGPQTRSSIFQSLTNSAAFRKPL